MNLSVHVDFLSGGFTIKAGGHVIKGNKKDGSSTIHSIKQGSNSLKLGVSTGTGSSVYVTVSSPSSSVGDVVDLTSDSPTDQQSNPHKRRCTLAPPTPPTNTLAPLLQPHPVPSLKPRPAVAASAVTLAPLSVLAFKLSGSGCSSGSPLTTTGYLGGGLPAGYPSSSGAIPPKSNVQMTIPKSNTGVNQSSTTVSKTQIRVLTNHPPSNSSHQPSAIASASSSGLGRARAAKQKVKVSDNYVEEGILDLEPNIFEPAYDRDLTWTIDDGKHRERGFVKYNRPFGWKRKALNIMKKFGGETNFDWLGGSEAMTEDRRLSVDLEWPVSYHGTTVEAAKSIIKEGFCLNKGTRFAYGKGVYSSPDPQIAEAYATPFMVNGRRYKVILQNRVSLEDMVAVNNQQYYLTSDDRKIRPYAVLFKRV